MRFEFFLAQRFLSGQRFGVFRLVTTVIAIGGTAIGVAALLVTLAIMDGFKTDIQEKILGTQPHIVVTDPYGSMIAYEPAVMNSLQSVEHIKAVSPYINAQTLVQTDRKVTGLILRGVRPELENNVTLLSKVMTQGTWQDLNDHSIVLGQELAASIRTRVGSMVTLIAPQDAADALGSAPRMRRYKVAGIFRSGIYDFDANLAFVTLGAAQELLGIGNHITGYGVRLDDVDHTTASTFEIAPRLGSAFLIRSWQDLNKPLFSAMKLERTVMFLVVTLIIIVSSFTIISNLLLLTIEKAREIGILQALGASPRQVGKIFLFHGLILGGSGVGLGLLLGIALSEILKRYPIIKLPSDVYYDLDRLPIHLSVHMIESVAVCAFLLVLVAVLYPAYKAHQMDPLQAIRYG